MRKNSTSDKRSANLVRSEDVGISQMVIQSDAKNLGAANEKTQRTPNIAEKRYAVKTQPKPVPEIRSCQKSTLVQILMKYPESAARKTRKP